MSNTAATGTDLHKIHHRYLYGQAAPFHEPLHPPHLESGHHTGDPSLNEA